MKHLVIALALIFSSASWSVQIFVRDHENRTKTIDVELDETVSSVKNKIAEKIRLACELQRLVFGGKQLQDDKTLSEYGIEPGSTIVLLLRISVSNQGK